MRIPSSEVRWADLPAPLREEYRIRFHEWLPCVLAWLQADPLKHPTRYPPKGGATRPLSQVLRPLSEKAAYSFLADEIGYTSWSVVKRQITHPSPSPHPGRILDLKRLVEDRIGYEWRDVPHLTPGSPKVYQHSHSPEDRYEFELLRVWVLHTTGFSYQDFHIHALNLTPGGLLHGRRFLISRKNLLALRGFARQRISLHKALLLSWEMVMKTDERYLMAERCFGNLKGELPIPPDPGGLLI